MKNVLDIEVSIFANYFAADDPKQVNLLKWLKSAKYAKVVEQIRQIEDKATRDKLKAKLPAITPSGIFGRREKKGLIKHTGLIAIDIDYKDNEHIGNFYELKEEICKINNIAYCGLSVSGRGYFVIIPILYPERHEQHFDALKVAFAAFNIIIDESCRNVDRLRGYSYDPDAVFKETAKPYSNYIEPMLQNNYKGLPTCNEAEKVESILRQIEANRIDITGNYETWRDLGFALANEFGEAGREYFHRVSQFSPSYRDGKIDPDAQYSRGLKGKGGKTIATFYKIAEQYGIRFKSDK